MEMSMKDKIRATSFGFIEAMFRNGASKALAVDDIKTVTTRTEGGCTIRLRNNHSILLDCSYESVMKAIRFASEGGHHAATA
jgi:hypothetical protein